MPIQSRRQHPCDCVGTNASSFLATDDAPTLAGERHQPDIDALKRVITSAGERFDLVGPQRLDWIEPHGSSRGQV